MQKQNQKQKRKRKRKQKPKLKKWKTKRRPTEYTAMLCCHSLAIYHALRTLESVEHLFFSSVNHLRRLWQVLTIQVSFVNTMFCLLLYQLAYFAGISLTSFLRAVLGATDHKGVMRGRCTLCPCVGYKEAKSTNKCAGCFCHIAPTAKHDGLSNWFSFSFSKFWFWFWFWFWFLFLFCFLLLFFLMKTKNREIKSENDSLVLKRETVNNI